MGSKKKNSTKQQGQDKAKGQANGHQHKTSTSSNASPKRNDRPGKSAKSSRDSASPRRSAPPPESRVPWRLLLVLGVVAGGVAIAWTNESARATVEDVYKRHVRPQVLRASEGLSLGYATIHQMLHGDPPSPSSDTQEPPPAPQEAESSRAASDSSRPPNGGGTDQRKKQTQDSATPSSAATATTTTTTTTMTTTTPPPPPLSPPDVKSEKEAGKTDPVVKPEAAKDAGKKPVDEMIQDEEGQPERKIAGKRKEDSQPSISKEKDKKMGESTDRKDTDGNSDADGKPEKKVNEKVSSDDSKRVQTAQKEKMLGKKSETKEEPLKEGNIEEDKASRKEQPARDSGAKDKRGKADAGRTVDANKSQDERQKDAAPSKQAKKDEKQPPKTEDEAKVKQERDSKKDKPTQDDQPKQQDSRAGEKSTAGKSKEEKTVEADLPTPDAHVKDARGKEDVAQEPVVKEIKVKTTPKAEKNAPSGKDKDTADSKLRNEKPDDKKAPPKPGDKSDEKPVASSDKKPVASKPADPKDSKPVTPKSEDKPDTKPPSQKPAGIPDQKQTDRPGDEPETPKPTEKSSEKPVASKPAETPTDKPASTSQKPVDKSKEKAAAQTAAEKIDQRPGDKPDQKPSDKPDQKPADKQDKKPADKQDKKPADKQDKKPADKQDQKPVDKPDKTPADKPPDKKPADRPDQKQDKRPTGEEASRAPTEKPDKSPAKKSDDESTAQAQKAAEKAKKNLAAQKPSDTGKDRSASQPQDGYAKASVTNDADYKIRGKLDEADDLLEKDKYEDALRKYDNILRKHPTSPRAQLGRASTLDKMSAQKRSNDLLELSIKGYHNLLMDSSDAPPELIITAGRRLADRQQFRGWSGKAVQTLKFLAGKFPEDVALKQELGVSHLLAGQLEPARLVFQEILALQPHNGFAQCHLGFILKTLDNNHEEAVKLLQAGIDSREQGTQDGRFFFHLGDAYNRLGRSEESRKVYQRGAEIGLFLSADQRSLYNVDHLTARPWWTPKQTGYQKHLKLLEDNWKTIRDEALSQLNTKTASFQPEAESLLDKGDWKQLTLYQQGRRNKAVCEKVPKTCGLIEQIPDAKGCKRGQVKFSVMSPGVHVWPHCGPTNCRVRAHLGLVVPEGPRIRVVNETRTWKEGKFIIFDDSFEHEVWHDGDSFRLVLIVDFWHPELTEALKRSLPPI